MGRSCRQLALDERRAIFRLLNAKPPIGAISKELNVTD